MYSDIVKKGLEKTPHRSLFKASGFTDEEIERVCKLAQADEFIQTFPDKYDTYIEQGGSNVSSVRNRDFVSQELC